MKAALVVGGTVGCLVGLEIHDWMYLAWVRGWITSPNLLVWPIIGLFAGAALAVLAVLSVPFLMGWWLSRRSPNCFKLQEERAARHYRSIGVAGMSVVQLEHTGELVGAGTILDILKEQGDRWLRLWWAVRVHAWRWSLRPIGSLRIVALSDEECRQVLEHVAAVVAQGEELQAGLGDHSLLAAVVAGLTMCRRCEVLVAARRASAAMSKESLLTAVGDVARDFDMEQQRIAEADVLEVLEQLENEVIRLEAEHETAGLLTR